MRAMDCEQGHDKIHLTGDNDDKLLEKVKEHAAEYHMDLTEDQLVAMIKEAAYDEM